MEKKRKIWWKLYFYIVFILNLFILIGLFSSDGLFDNYYMSEIIFELFELLLLFIGVIGLFGFVYLKQIFYKDFWIFIFILSIIDLIGSTILHSQIKEFIWVYILILPFYIGLYKYSFKMDELWSKNG